MSTTLLTITPVAVGTNEQVPNVAFSATDWIELKNDSPFSLAVTILGVSSNELFLTPFEHNGWPIQHLLQTAQLKVNNLSLVITPSHYYSDVATENNSPTNICTVNLLSQQEAQTNTYPLYTARMNTTVATIANSLTNVGNPAGQSIIFSQSLGDPRVDGEVNISNNGIGQFGNLFSSGLVEVIDTAGDETQIFGDHITMTNGYLQVLTPSSIINGFTSGTVTITQTLRGTLKHIIFLFNNFRNGGGTSQFFSLPQKFLTGFSFYAGNITPMQFLSSGVAQNIGIITTFASGGGTPTIQTTLNKYSIGDNFNPCDQVAFLGSQASAFTGMLILQGV